MYNNNIEITQNHHETSASYLLGVKLVKLCLLAVPPPQTQYFGLRAVGHINELLIPPALIDRANVTAQDNAVITHLHKHTHEEKVNIYFHPDWFNVIHKQKLTSMKNMSPVVSVPAWTTNVCFFMCRLPLGLMESSRPVCNKIQNLSVWT